MLRRSKQKICWKNNYRWPVAVFLVCLLATAAAAAPPDGAVLDDNAPAADCAQVTDCVTMVQSARRLSDASQLNAALQTYESAYARWPSPWLLINIGRMQQKLGLPAAAITTYQRYLEQSAGDKPERITAAREFLKQAEQDLAASRAAASRPVAKPVYKKWWFWTALAGVALATGGITAAIILGTSEVVPNGTPGPFAISF